MPTLFTLAGQVTSKATDTQNIPPHTSTIITVLTYIAIAIGIIFGSGGAFAFVKFLSERKKTPSEVKKLDAEVDSLHSAISNEDDKLRNDLITIARKDIIEQQKYYEHQQAERQKYYEQQQQEMKEFYERKQKVMQAQIDHLSKQLTVDQPLRERIAELEGENKTLKQQLLEHTQNNEAETNKLYAQLEKHQAEIKSLREQLSISQQK